MFCQDYSRVTRKMTPAQKKAYKINLLKDVIARRACKMESPINADAPAYWWAQMTKLQAQDKATLESLLNA